MVDIVPDIIYFVIVQNTNLPFCTSLSNRAVVVSIEYQILTCYVMCYIKCYVTCYVTWAVTCSVTRYVKLYSARNVV